MRNSDPNRNTARSFTFSTTLACRIRGSQSSASRTDFIYFSVLYQSDSYKEKGRVFFDVNKLSADGTTAISGYSWTEDGSKLAITLADKGSDICYAQFYDNEGGQLDDKIPSIKFSGVEWLPNNEAVIYSVSSIMFLDSNLV